MKKRKNMPKYVYCAMLHQAGTSDPVTVTVLKNTFPNEPVWQHIAQGVNLCTLQDMFPVGKTFVTFSPIIQNDTSFHSFIYANINYLPNGIEVYTGSYQYNGVDAFERYFNDGMLDNQYIKIEVFA
jgi:hypothetical protein